jgi:hypothetical protein
VMEGVVISKYSLAIALPQLVEYKQYSYGVFERKHYREKALHGVHYPTALP